MDITVTASQALKQKALIAESLCNQEEGTHIITLIYY